MEQAFLTALKGNQQIIHKICSIYRDTRQDQEDLFQEIVFQLWKSFPSFRGDAKISSWVYRVALNVAMAVYRKPAIEIKHYDKLPEPGDSSSMAGHSENQERMFTALRLLTDAEKAIISLFLDDFSYREIAEIAGISESNVGVRLTRIKSKLKKLLN